MYGIQGEVYYFGAHERGRPDVGGARVHRTGGEWLTMKQLRLIQSHVSIEKTLCFYSVDGGSGNEAGRG